MQSNLSIAFISTIKNNLSRHAQKVQAALQSDLKTNESKRFMRSYEMTKEYGLVKVLGCLIYSWIELLWAFFRS